MTNENIVLSFYKYAEIKNTAEAKEWQTELCKSLNLKGRILISKEGINGSVYGTKDNIKNYKEEVRKNNLFSGIEFKEQASENEAFKKLYISIRKEIVHFGYDVNLDNTGKFLAPIEVKSMLDGREDIVLLDIRNDYESKIGKFKDAVTLGIKNFREFPSAVGKIKNLRDKRVVAYCTGGIRCEKATAFLKQNGFEDVSQIQGGILKFAEEFPDTYWEGRCFVFDERIAIDVNRSGHALTRCGLCGNRANNYINCHNMDCDKLFVGCENCIQKFGASCSEKCAQSPNRRKKNTVQLELSEYAQQSF